MTTEQIQRLASEIVNGMDMSDTIEQAEQNVARWLSDLGEDEILNEMSDREINLSDLDN